jgi:hypothetical protein
MTISRAVKGRRVILAAGMEGADQSSQTPCLRARVGPGFVLDVHLHHAHRTYHRKAQEEVSLYDLA